VLTLIQSSFTWLTLKSCDHNIVLLSKREGKFQVETDELEHAMEGVLFQEQKGKLKPIIFLSKMI